MERKLIDPSQKLRRLETFFKQKKPTLGRENLLIQDTTFYSYLNQLVSQLNPETEYYLEAGVFVGTTLISAAINNKTKCYGVDNFTILCKQQPAIDILNQNLDKCGLTNVEYFNMRFQDFFDNPPIDKKVKIYFYDADHGYNLTYEGIVKAKSVLADQALIIIHDTDKSQSEEPWNAAMNIVKNEKEFSFIQEISGSTEWPCGVIFLEYKREGFEK